jgi:hypothetical protein
MLLLYIEQKEGVAHNQAELIATCFKQLYCFLMPHPGNDVTTRQFTGLLQGIENFPL